MSKNVFDYPWTWRNFGGGTSLFTQGGGALVVLAPKSYPAGPPGMEVRGSGENEGILVAMTPDHPVARAIASGTRWRPLAEHMPAPGAFGLLGTTNINPLFWDIGLGMGVVTAYRGEGSTPGWWIGNAHSGSKFIPDSDKLIGRDFWTHFAPIGPA